MMRVRGKRRSAPFHTFCAPFGGTRNGSKKKSTNGIKSKPRADAEADTEADTDTETDSEGPAVDGVCPSADSPEALHRGSSF